MKKVILSMFLAASILVSSVPVQVQAAEKSITGKMVVNKKTVGNGLIVKVNQKLGKKEPSIWSNVTIKVLKIKGKQKKKYEDYVLAIDSDACKNGAVLETKKGELKKGAVFTFQGDQCELYGDLFISGTLPKGITSITYKITVTNSAGKSIIESMEWEDSDY